MRGAIALLEPYMPLDVGVVRESLSALGASSPGFRFPVVAAVQGVFCGFPPRVEDPATLRLACNSNNWGRAGAPFDSAWTIKSYDNIYINIYNIRKIRGSSYIPTPEKFSNPKCGLVNIQNDDQECFRWCMLYHQSKQQKNDHRITVLKKINDKYDYKDIDFPTDTDDLYRFEK